MKEHRFARRFVSGLIDGLSLAFALAAGLSSIAIATRNIFMACVAITVAGAITMTAGGYMTAKTYQSDPRPFAAALAIGCGYLLGGLLVCLPYVWQEDTGQALTHCCLLALPALAIAGFLDNFLNGARGWTGGVRVLIIGAAAASCAYAVAQLFR